MNRLRMIVLMMLATAPLAYGAGSGGMSGGGDMGASAPAARTPKQMEAASYNAGLNHKKRAAQYETKAASAKNAKDRDKQLAKASEQYLAAIDDYKKAIGYNNRSYQALNELGYALRKSGDYASAVQAYDAALLVNADFAPAIEYRGEAYLALGMFPQVQETYLALFRTDQDHAATLLQAMEAWVQAQPEQATPEAKAFSEWVVERKSVAAQTQSLSQNNVRDWH
jgi:tetratricopeptide (TPR) repeat protein